MAFWSKWFGGKKKPVPTATSELKASDEEHFVLHIRDLPEKSIDNLPDSRWPPFPRAVKAIDVRDIINSQAELIRSLCRVCPLSEEQINEYLLPSIVNLANFVHLLPASQYDHHMGTGGLFCHSLEVAYYSVNGAKSNIFDITESPERAHLNRGRWVLASALGGLAHDVGKAVTDMIVTSGDDQDVWYPRQETLTAWLRRKKLDSYYVSWKQNREHNKHQTASVDYAHIIIPQKTFQFLSSAGNFRIEQEIRDAILSSVSSRQHPLADLLARADKLSCKIDKDRRKGIDPKDFYVSSPIAESVVDALRDLVKTGKWKVNEPGGRVFITNVGTFVVWTDLDDLIQYLCSKEIRAVPREPNVLADILIDHGVGIAPPAELTTAEGRYWSICPICSANGFLTTLRIDDPKRLFSSGIAPMPIVAMIRGMELSDEDKEAWIARHGAVPQSKNVTEMAEDEAWINSLLEDAEKYAEEVDDTTEVSWMNLLPSDFPDEEVPSVPDYLLKAEEEEHEAAGRNRPDGTANAKHAPNAPMSDPNKPGSIEPHSRSEENGHGEADGEAPTAENLMAMLTPNKGRKAAGKGKKNPGKKDAKQDRHETAEGTNAATPPSSPEKETESRGPARDEPIHEEPADKAKAPKEKPARKPVVNFSSLVPSRLNRKKDAKPAPQPVEVSAETNVPTEPAEPTEPESASLSETDLKALVNRAIEAVELQKRDEAENSSTQDAKDPEPAKEKPLPTRLLTEEDALAVGYKPGEAYFLPEELSTGPDPSYFDWVDAIEPAKSEENIANGESDKSDDGNAGETETQFLSEVNSEEPYVPNELESIDPAGAPVADGDAKDLLAVLPEQRDVEPASEGNIPPRSDEAAGEADGVETVDKDKRPSRTWIGAPMYTTAEVKKEVRTEQTTPNAQPVKPAETPLPSSPEKEKKTGGDREEEDKVSSQTNGTKKAFDMESFLPSRHPKLSKKGAESKDNAESGALKKSSSRGGSKGAKSGKTGKAVKTFTNPETILRDMFAQMKEQFARQEGPWLEDVKPDRYGVRCDGRKFLSEAEKAGVVAPELLLVSIVGRAQKTPVLAWDASTKEFIYKNRP